MRSNMMLTYASLLSIVLMTIHLTDDVLRGQGGMGQGGYQVLLHVLVLLVWLYGTLVLADKRAGIIIILVGSLLSSFVAIGDLTGSYDVVVGEIAKSSGGFYAWAVIALGVTALFSLVLAARALFTPQANTSRPASLIPSKPAAKRR